MKNSRWSREQEAVLLQTVQRASTTAKGVRTASRKLRRTPGSCAQRYYVLQNSNNVSPSIKRMRKDRVFRIDGEIKSINITRNGIDLVFNP